MKRTIITFTLLLSVVTAVTPVSNVSANASGFNAGRIIDDAVFTNKSSMSVSQIQSFLNSKVPNCDTNGRKVSEYGGGTRAQWAQARYGQSTFTCLRDYSENGNSAAQMIYNVSQEFSINPQVLIVLLQKEQGLVTDEWPLNIQYRTATGYGCPDTAPCDAQYYGLGNQLTWAARMFRAILNNSPTWYTPYVLGNNFIRYSPDASCGGSNVNIQNRSTQALYNYTPYQPNQAALNAGYGTVSCGAYGNRNFYLYFTDWFGNPTISPVYSWSPVYQALYLDSARTVEIPYGASLEPGQKVYVRITAKNTGNQVWSKSTTNLGTSSPNDRDSLFRTSDWISSNRLSVMTQSQVAPNETATFDTTFIAPSSLGNYNERFNIVVEGIAWMNDPGLYIPIKVAPSRDIVLFQDADKTGKIGSTVYNNSKVYVQATITNKSTSTIPRNAVLATTNPNDRISDLRDASWISANRIQTLGVDIKPGETKVINFILSVPSTIKTYNESFGLVVDGTNGGWIENNTATVQFTSVPKPLDVISDQQSISSGQAIVSSNSKYTLVLQSDGNLVLYSPSRAVWASNTVGSNGNRLVMQSDGNLVLYSPSRAVWASNTVGKGTSDFVLQSDGNAVIYKRGGVPIWATNTTN